MATSVDVIERAEPRAVSVRWIISARDDLVWLIGSVASSYLLLVLYVKGVLPLIPMVALWAILIDAPHVFGTFSRTYFDRTERQNRARLLWGSLLFFTIGPLMVYAGAALIFFFLAALWASGPVAVGTPALFDVGVFLVVAGVVLMMIFTLAEES